MNTVQINPQLQPPRKRLGLTGLPFPAQQIPTGSSLVFNLHSANQINAPGALNGNPVMPATSYTGVSIKRPGGDVFRSVKATYVGPPTTTDALPGVSTTNWGMGFQDSGTLPWQNDNPWLIDSVSVTPPAPVHDVPKTCPAGQRLQNGQCVPVMLRRGGGDNTGGSYTGSTTSSKTVYYVAGGVVLLAAGGAAWWKWGRKKR